MTTHFTVMMAPVSRKARRPGRHDNINLIGSWYFVARPEGRVVMTTLKLADSHVTLVARPEGRVVMTTTVDR